MIESAAAGCSRARVLRRPARGRWLAALALLLGITVLPGYRMIWPDVHEGMTRAAKQCLDAAAHAGAKPAFCERDLFVRGVDVTWIRGSSRRFYDVFAWFKHVTGIESNYPTLIDAVRWPDDPTRQLTDVSIFKWFVNVALDDCLDGDTIDIDDGLLCNSHYGDMQFLHAQATAAGEPAPVTYHRVMQWATFLYRVASGDIDDATLDTPYCAFFEDADDAFHAAMLPSQLAVPCETVNDPPWTLTTLFTMRCSDPFASIRCREELGPSRFDRSRVYATGALLHVIQDSFAQGHCARGECEIDDDGTVRAKVECEPITMFTTYRGQDTDRHTDADMWPTFTASCTPLRDVDDPVTASAKMLWHVRNASPLDSVMPDLERVFGTAAEMTRVVPAGLGVCFAPQPRSSGADE